MRWRRGARGLKARPEWAAFRPRGSGERKAERSDVLRRHAAPPPPEGRDRRAGHFTARVTESLAAMRGAPGGALIARIFCVRGTAGGVRGTIGFPPKLAERGACPPRGRLYGGGGVRPRSPPTPPPRPRRGLCRAVLACACRAATGGCGWKIAERFCSRPPPESLAAR